MTQLMTNFKDDILAESMEGRRRYQMLTNEDGTVSFVDVTEYLQKGNEFGQAEVNAIHRELNKKFDSGNVVAPLVAEEEGYAADAKLTGDAIREVSANLAGVLLWENPNESASMPETSITLSSADCDFYEIYYRHSKSSNFMMYQKALKGAGFYLCYSGISGSGAVSHRRTATFVSDTSINISNGETAIGASAPYLNNDICIPVRIIGYKS